jgi:hypothetical protein
MMMIVCERFYTLVGAPMMVRSQEIARDSLSHPERSRRIVQCIARWMRRKRFTMICSCMQR